ncbi:MAG TPA: nitroreductase family protein [Candidatus Saccharimonadales bacterium]|nr:nitroreductase family protein [Candidatus Saccharimonadales bacterium]
MIGPKHTHRRHRQRLSKKSIHHYQDDQKKIHHILEYGVLAPSTHNTQPWKIEVKDNTVKIFADHSKKIPQADPSGRDLYMSLGALIKNIELASQAYGIDYQIKHAVKITDNLPISTVIYKDLKPNSKINKKLLHNIKDRQNYRGYFQPILNKSSEVKDIIAASGPDVDVQLVTDKTTIQELAKLTARGLRMAYASREFRREISSYINHNLSIKKHGLHGYSLRMNFPKSVVIPKVMKRKDIGERLSAINYRSFISAPTVAILYSVDTKEGWLKAGMLMQEVMVKLTGLGISSSIYAAAIEMGDLRNKVSQLTPPKNKNTIPQLLFCIGKPKDKLPYSARKKLGKVLTS